MRQPTDTTNNLPRLQETPISSTDPAVIPEEVGDNVETVLPRQPTIQAPHEPARSSTMPKKTEPEPQPETRHSTLDEPLANLDIYGANPTEGEEASEEPSDYPIPEKIASIQAVPGVSEASDVETEENPSALSAPGPKDESFTPEPPAKQPATSASQQPLRPTAEPFVSEQLEPSPQQPLPGSGVEKDPGTRESPFEQPVSGGTKALPATSEDLHEPSSGKLDDPTTTDPEQNPVLPAPPDAPKPVPQNTMEKLERRKSFLPRILTSPAEKQRKPSSAAPATMAPYRRWKTHRLIRKPCWQHRQNNQAKS